MFIEIRNLSIYVTEIYVYFMEAEDTFILLTYTYNDLTQRK